MRGKICRDLVPAFFICWLPLALILSAINIRSSIDVFNQFHGRPDLERKRIAAGDMFPTIEACLTYTQDYAKIVIAGFPYDEGFRLDYYLYPRRICFREKGSIQDIIAYCKSEKIDYYLVYDEAGRPAVEKVQL